MISIGVLYMQALRARLASHVLLLSVVAETFAANIFLMFSFLLACTELSHVTSKQ